MKSRERKAIIQKLCEICTEDLSHMEEYLGRSLNPKEIDDLIEDSIGCLFNKEAVELGKLGFPNDQMGRALFISYLKKNPKKTGNYFLEKNCSGSGEEGRPSGQPDKPIQVNIWDMIPYAESFSNVYL